ncbi:MAG: Thiamine synthesis protein ApbE [Thermoanaerobacterales bacterium 50_218]|nr:MAG: Thiamine synthesis protein ApbE [Thermoanaerobacterales bacterium 50_218]
MVVRMRYHQRTYRKQMRGEGLVSFQIRLKESDLFISVDEKSFQPELREIALSLLHRFRRELEVYLDVHPSFGESLRPLKVPVNAPRIVRMMAGAASRAGVGPMAAVAGAVAELVGRGLLRFVSEVIVENGGDIFMKTDKPRVVGIFAGTSRFSEKIGVKLDASNPYWGICTSSGTVGPSLSFGSADAAVVVSKMAALADAVATAAGNRVHSPEDIPETLRFGCGVRGIEGVVLIHGDTLGAMGNVELVPLE